MHTETRTSQQGELNYSERFSEHCSLQLIGGLADEKGRWEESIARFEVLLKNFVGDMVVASAYVAYLGPFTMEFRKELAAEWRAALAVLQVICRDD